MDGRGSATACWECCPQRCYWARCIGSAGWAWEMSSSAPTIGAWIWAGQLVMALVMMGLAGGLMALAWAAYGGFLKETLSGAGDLVFGLRKRGLRPHATLVLAHPAARKMPYAPAIAFGVLFSFLVQS